jgi:ABC-type Fe3+ transport system permease subunit
LPAGCHVITTKIWALFQYPPNPHLAAAAALPLLLVTILLLQGRQWLLGRRGYTVVGGKSGAPRLVVLGLWRWPAVAFALGILALPIFLPYAALITSTPGRGKAFAIPGSSQRNLTRALRRIRRDGRRVRRRSSRLPSRQS